MRVFMLIPGVEIPHLCAQCVDYPCIAACPVTALSANETTRAVLVDREKCTSCGLCITACPGQIPFLHPGDKKAVICDLCNGDPECAKVCTEAQFDALRAVKEGLGWGGGLSQKLFAQIPEELTKDVAVNLFGEKAEEMNIDD